MAIIPSTIDDLDTIMQLYQAATAFQTTRFHSVWPTFDKSLIIKEIQEKRQWKLIINGKMAFIWAITFSDPLIWKEKNKTPAIYIHRITAHPDFRGQGHISKVLLWAKNYAIQHQKVKVRLDTVGDNKKLITYYQKWGFTYLGLFPLKEFNRLPKHYHNASVSLFEMSI